MSHFNSKHSHLREPVMTYFLTHTWEETLKKFKLTQSELKSLFSAGYRDPKLKHLRKDTRRKDPWTLEEMLFLIQNAGIRERAWIAKKLNRAGARNIKERMRSWNAATKFLNGMPITWAATLWPNAKLPAPIRTLAGPTGNNNQFCFRILSWQTCKSLSMRYPTPPEIRAGIQAMYKFQSFIYRTNSSAWIRRKINASLKLK